MLAARFGHAQCVKDLLVHFYIEVNNKNKNEKTALDLAMEHKHRKIADMLRHKIKFLLDCKLKKMEKKLEVESDIKSIVDPMKPEDFNLRRQSSRGDRKRQVRI